MSFDLRRSAHVAGLVGGLAWVVALFLDGGGLDSALLWIGAVLLTVALFALGLLLVRSDVLALRAFVGVALPTLVWGVFGIVHQSASDQGLVDAVFGAAVGIVSAIGLGRHVLGGGRAAP